MKHMIFLASLVSFSSFASYDEDCARRYIEASESLVSIAQEFNEGQIGKFEYALAVEATDAEVLGLRMYCMNEDAAAEKCVNDTKSAYKKIRAKMIVSSVLKGNTDKVSVGVIDLRRLLPGAARGLFGSIFSDKENICTLD